MLDGLWTVEFESNFGIFGYGAVVFVNNRILGGDNQYYYVGDAIIEDSNVKAKIKVNIFNKVGASVFGNIDNFTIHVSGIISEPQMELNGFMEENQNLKIKIKCERRSRL